MLASTPTWTRSGPSDLTCFQSPLPFGCERCPTREALIVVGQADVLRYVTNGAVRCPRCRRNVDMRRQFAGHPVFGNPESLFGLRTWVTSREIPATTHPQVLHWDVGLELPHEGRIVYANVTNAGAGPVDEMPSLMLWNQSPHEPWSTSFRFHIPPGGERGISLLVVVKPEAPALPFPLEIALQAVDAFHRNQFGVAAIMLAASVEASLRPCVREVYSSRRVSAQDDLAFAALLERARLLLNPQPGPKLVEGLQKLAKVGRNTAAHGRPTELTREQVAGWMVDVAAVYEWVQLARPNGVSAP